MIAIESVRTIETRGGNVRYVVRDTDGNQYTTFREAIGDRARVLPGRAWMLGSVSARDGGGPPISTATSRRLADCSATNSGPQTFGHVGGRLGTFLDISGRLARWPGTFADFSLV